ncbi:hypothetical protein EON82_07570 [bacterium]|nr:MAG: hypothetical protein EON82_07570 [bacterium]
MLPEQRYAEWRPVAIRRWATSWVGFLSGASLFILLWVLSRSFNYGFFILCAALGRYVTARLVAHQLQELRDDPDGGQYASALRVSREVTYGFDEGLLAFENGWLVYSGRRCAFSLPASAVRVRTIDKTTVAFAFGPPEDERTVHLTTASNERLQQEAAAWRDAESVEGEAVVLPPLRPDETGFAAVKSIAGFAAMAVLILALCLIFFPGQKTQLALLTLAVSIPAVGIYAVEAQRALRRVANGLPRELPIWRRAFVPAKHRDALPPKADNR